MSGIRSLRRGLMDLGFEKSTNHKLIKERDCVKKGVILKVISIVFVLITILAIACAITAAALVELRGGTAEQCAEAFAMALTNLEGLVCDPVAGLVEIPCIKRNVIGAMNAVSCADMALAGVVGHIPADEVIDAMAEVGAAMSNDLRETGIGGLAGTPTGKAIRDIVQMQG